MKHGQELAFGFFIPEGDYEGLFLRPMLHKGEISQ